MNKQIIVEDGKVLVVNADGSSTIQPFVNKVSAEYVMHTYTSVNAPRYLYQKNDIIDVYTKAGDELGVSVAVFKKMLNGAIYRAYVADNKDLHSRLSYLRIGHRPVKDTEMVNLVNARAEFIRQFMSDNNVHTSAFGLFFDSTSDAKKELGKSLWKAVCRNSKTRNDTMCKIVHTDDRIAQRIRALNQLPSTLLNNLYDETIVSICELHDTVGIKDIVSKILNRLNRPLCRIEDSNINGITTTISDTRRMVEDFNPRWSLTRIYEEHKRAIIAEATKDAPKEPFECAQFLPGKIVKDGFIAILCSSPYDLTLLGAEQHHCVGSYRDMVEDFYCAVYKVIDDGDVVSTLSISHPATKNRSAIQHMYAWNAHVKDDKRVQFAKYVCRKVQRAMLEDGIIPLTDRIIVPPLNGPGAQIVPRIAAPGEEVLYIDGNGNHIAYPHNDDNIPF